MRSETMGGVWGPMHLLGGWLAVVLTLAVPAVQADDACLKMVFGQYCLGGDVKAQLTQGGQPLLQQGDGERLALIYAEGPDQVYVLAFRDRIYKVVRSYRAATQLRYDDIYSALREKYGEGEDRSRFPPYATTPARRIGSIRRGDGRAVHYWKPAKDWHIELTWTRELGLALAYIATELNAQQKAAVQGGL